MSVSWTSSGWFAWFSQYNIGWSLPQCGWILLVLEVMSLEKRLWGESMPTNPIMREMHLILSHSVPYPRNWMGIVGAFHRRLEEDAWLVIEDDDDHPAFLHDWIRKTNSAHRVYCSCIPMGLSWLWKRSWVSRSVAYTPSRSCITASRWYAMSALPMWSCPIISVRYRLFGLLFFLAIGRTIHHVRNAFAIPLLHPDHRLSRILHT